jgi:flagellar biosynthesis protein FliP
MGDFIRCARQSFNEMLHDENYQVGILLAIVFVLLFLPIFNVQGHFALKMQIAMVIATIVSLPFLLMFVFALDNCYSLFKSNHAEVLDLCTG